MEIGINEAMCPIYDGRVGAVRTTAFAVETAH